jgi:hypothetical protein
LLADWRQHEVVHPDHNHAEQPGQAEKPAEKPSAQPAGNQESKPEEQPQKPGESPAGTPTPKEQAGDLKPHDGAAEQPQKSAFVDRQLQMAVDYLVKELEKEK